MDGDPNFRLKLFVVMTGVVGVFLLVFVGQRVWFWTRTRRREDIATSNVKPLVDFGLLGLGACMIWLAIEGLILSLSMPTYLAKPPEPRKIAEIEVGRINGETDNVTLLFYPVDDAGHRLSALRRPVFTQGSEFEVQVEIYRWRDWCSWLGDLEYYQVVNLGGRKSRTTARPRSENLALGDSPSGISRFLFMQPTETTDARDKVVEGVVYDVWLSDVVEIRRRDDQAE